MESQPQNPEFRINPENFHPCIIILYYKRPAMYLFTSIFSNMFVKWVKVQNFQNPEL